MQSLFDVVCVATVIETVDWLLSGDDDNWEVLDLGEKRRVVGLEITTSISYLCKCMSLSIL